MEAIRLEDVTFRYPDSGRDALSHISLSVKQGELVLLCGSSGSGKSTLLRLIKRSIAPHGELTGDIFILGRKSGELSEREAVSQIGFVFQNAENGIVTESVFRELAFGLESLGEQSAVIRRKAAETAMYYGIDKLYRRKTSTLSGGEKQLLSLACAMVTEPQILLLDEPTSQLDPISAKELLAAVFRLNRELGVTVIISEHRTDELFQSADRVLYLDGGALTVDALPERAATDTRFPLGALPAAAQVFRLLGGSGTECPLTTAAARAFLRDRCVITEPEKNEDENPAAGAVTIKLRGVCFSYDKASPEILRDLSLDIRSGEVLAVLGGNGAGKSTLLKLITGVLKPTHGRVKLVGFDNAKPAARSVVCLPQDPRDLFLCDTVKDDVLSAGLACGLDTAATQSRADELLSRFGISELAARHPYDLSGGELQKAALVKLLMMSPKVLLLDEPTKGMDFVSKSSVTETVRALRSSGVTVVLVTHDTLAAAECADRCALLFDGAIVSEDPPSRFFSELSHYTTQQAHITRGLLGGAVTNADILAAARLKEGSGDGAR